MFISSLISRKLISASVSSCIFVIIFAWFEPSVWSDIPILEYNSFKGYIKDSISSIPIYFTYALPVILIYGTLTSLICEFIVYNIFEYTPLRKSNLNKFILMGLLHLAFGMVLLYISLLAAILFFLVDQWLSYRRQVYNWRSVFKSFFIPLCFFIFWVSLVWFIAHKSTVIPKSFL
ncbi:fatty acid desaturase [Paenibacillus qinlingensis]|uniref:Fatty acid desaturase n=1 Tax=Paenibacillus qinlingensis TaxID=1837343 RepID=A0ABU1NYL4_9BACL|nr:fatty acid desaturase [Paenibacillus qinlingensis]